MRAALSLVPVLFAVAASTVAQEPTSVVPAEQRTGLRAGEMLGNWSYAEPLSLDAYAPRTNGGRGADVFEGRLSLRAASLPPRMRVLRDEYGTAVSGAAAVSRLPDLDLDLVQHGDQLLPAHTGPIASSNPYWEFVVGTGKVWREPTDEGYSRASIPFALVEVNANCVHNGVLSFMFRADGRVSRTAYQVSSETCAYFKADLWGLLDTSYSPQPVAQRDTIVQAYVTAAAGLMASRPIGELARDYPGTDVASFAHPDDVKRGDLTTWGVVVGGVHYAGGCPTRAGEYPFCEQVVLPSYSLAKSMFAALALMRIEKLYPGTRLERVADHVPECRSSGNWADVSLEKLLDMTSGNYLSAADRADEYESGVDPGFFLPVTHAAKIDYACNRFPRRAPPGERFVYRTSDTYILGSAMSDVVRGKLGVNADVVDDVLAPGVWRAAGLSPRVESVRRTRDVVAQPFTGYGLLLQPDDVAKLARFFESTSTLPGKLLDPAMYRASMQRDQGDRGLRASEDGSLVYNNGFWAARVAGLPGCVADQYVPFMSGYGGISVVLMPNDVAYYYFSDGGDFHFMRALREAAYIRPYCVSGPSLPQPPGEQHR